MRRNVIIAIVILVIVTIGIVGVVKRDRIIAIATNSQSQQRQAIFLTNGQVYFGEIEKQDDRYLVLRGIFYLKTQDQLNANNNERKVSIIKLGDEAHRPEDRMFISRSQILYYEQMKKDSKINEAIDRYNTDHK